MKWYPHLAFNGQCESAFRFYERCLGGKVAVMLTWADSPMAEQAPEGFGEKILHATLTVGDNMLAGSDSLPGQYLQPQGFHILVNIGDPLEAERIFGALAENGSVAMPFQQTFWAAGFGVLSNGPRTISHLGRDGVVPFWQNTFLANGELAEFGL